MSSTNPPQHPDTPDPPDEAQGERAIVESLVHRAGVDRSVAERVAHRVEDLLATIVAEHKAADPFDPVWEELLWLVRRRPLDRMVLARLHLEVIPVDAVNPADRHLTVVATGVHHDGGLEPVGFTRMEFCDEAFWIAFLLGLRGRGLPTPDTISSQWLPGVSAATDLIYPKTFWMVSDEHFGI